MSVNSMYTIDRKNHAEHNGLLEEAVAKICNKHTVSGEEVWKTIEVLSIDKLKQYHGEASGYVPQTPVQNEISDCVEGVISNTCKSYDISDVFVWILVESYATVRVQQFKGNRR